MFGIDRSSFLSLDENRNTLGYYADKESITKEIDEIMIALANGSPTYELRSVSYTHLTLPTKA